MTAQTPPPPWAAVEAPFLAAPEGARTVFLVTLLAATAPLAGGIVLFGWRAAMVSALAIGSCAIIERLYFRVTRVPALLGRSHAYLTGVLLALTLPPFVPWYVPVIAAAFAIIVGKAVFGGVGHFLWQPALVGRLAVAVLFGAMLTPDEWPVLAQNRVLVGDVAVAKCLSPPYAPWQGHTAPAGYDAFEYPHPATVLRGLTDEEEPDFSGLISMGDVPGALPAAASELPSMGDLISGTRPGGIGETCAVLIIVAGLYLVYRNYVKWYVPVSIVLAAAATVAIAPVTLAGAGGAGVRVWWPVLHEGLDAGFVYVAFQLLGGELMLAAFFLATEMTSRPVTPNGQVVFGVGIGVGAMLLKLYADTSIPCYMAILAMNTLTPAIESIWRPRVLGRRRFAVLFRK